MFTNTVYSCVFWITMHFGSTYIAFQYECYAMRKTHAHTGCGNSAFLSSLVFWCQWVTFLNFFWNFREKNCSFEICRKNVIYFFYQYISSNEGIAVKLNDVLTWMKNISKKKRWCIFLPMIERNFMQDFLIQEIVLVLDRQKIRNHYQSQSHQTFFFTR